MNSINAHNWFFSVKRHVKGISQNFSDIIFHYQDQWELTVNDFPCPLDDGGCKGLDFQETYVMPAFKKRWLSVPVFPPNGTEGVVV